MAEARGQEGWPAHPPKPLMARARAEGWGQVDVDVAWMKTVVWYWTGNVEQTIRVLAASGFGPTPSPAAVALFVLTPEFEAMLAQAQVERSAHPAVATATELEAWWTERLRDNSDPVVALKASELLAKSKGMLKEKREITGQVEVALVAACRLLDERAAASAARPELAPDAGGVP